LEDKAARNKLASPVLMVVVSQVLSVTLRDAEQLEHSLVQVSKPTSLEQQLQGLQAQLAALTMAIASKNGSGIVPSSPVVEGPGPAVAHGGPSITEAETVTATTAAGDDPACEFVATRPKVSLRRQPLVSNC
jgi:hypothetical protein